MAFQNTYALNRDDCLKILESDKSEFQGKLFCGRVFFRSPLTDAIETIAVYSTSGHEVRTWVEHKIKFYKENNIPFVIYLNYQFEDANGDLFNTKEVK